MKKDSQRSRGRPRAFDKDAAIDAATQVFWRLGYANASLDELTTAMKLSRPSLYSAFGDKEGLFLTCLESHGGAIAARVHEAANSDGDVREILSNILMSALKIYTLPDPVPRGCLFAAASLSDVTLSPDLREAVTAQLARISRETASVIERAPPTHMPADAAARLFSSMLYGFASRARLGESLEVLSSDAEDMLNLLYPKSE
ncbi:MAG: hypothetical protein CMK07_15280 [Ponticaulis sp.]|nr:hypothetical protein [Ponticaulis sp.]